MIYQWILYINLLFSGRYITSMRVKYTNSLMEDDCRCAIRLTIGMIDHAKGGEISNIESLCRLLELGD